jgi:hypothetical protein
MRWVFDELEAGFEAGLRCEAEQEAMAAVRAEVGATVLWEQLARRIGGDATVVAGTRAFRGGVVASCPEFVVLRAADGAEHLIRYGPAVSIALPAEAPTLRPAPPAAARRYQFALAPRELAVVPMNVVDEDRHRGQAVERGVWSSVIVGPQPAGQGPGALVVGAVQPPIGPLIQQGLVEPLDLAIGLRTIRASSLAADPEPGGGLSEDDRLGVGLGVVGQDPLDPDPVLGEEGGCLDQEPGGCGAALIAQDLAEGNPGTVIDSRVNGVIADAPPPRSLGPAVDAVAAAVRDAAQLLDVEVDQLAGPLALVADHGAAGRSVWARRLRPWRRRMP